MRLQLLVSISVTWILVVLLIQLLISLNLISHSHSIKRSEEAKQLLKAGRCRREVLLELVGEQCSGELEFSSATGVAGMTLHYCLTIYAVHHTLNKKQNDINLTTVFYLYYHFYYYHILTR